MLRHPEALELKALERILVLSAHAGDALVGMGGTLARLHRLGASITLADTGSMSRSSTEASVLDPRVEDDEISASDERLGVGEHVRLPRRKGRLSPNRELVHAYVDLIRRHRPLALFSHFGQDREHDHRVVAAAAEEAWGRAAEDELPELGAPWKSPYFFCFELGELITFPTALIDVSDDLATKIAALELRPSLLRREPRLVEHVRALAALRGIARGSRGGEAFHELGLLSLPL